MLKTPIKRISQTLFLISFSLVLFALNILNIALLGNVHSMRTAHRSSPFGSFRFHSSTMIWILSEEGIEFFERTTGGFGTAVIDVSGGEEAAEQGPDEDFGADGVDTFDTLSARSKERGEIGVLKTYLSLRRRP
jgi:hypothetical protein